MYDKLAEMLEQGHYEDALAELGQIDIDDYTEELAILAVSTLLALGEYETAREYLQLGLKLNPRNANCICCWAIITRAATVYRRTSAMKTRNCIARTRRIKQSYRVSRKTLPQREI